MGILAAGLGGSAPNLRSFRLTLIEQLTQRLREAIAKIGAEGDPLVRAAHDEQFGDYQSNCAMGIAKKLGKNPREVAAAIVSNLCVDDLCEPAEIAGPGFVNLRLKPEYLSRRLAAIPPASEGSMDRLGIDPSGRPRIVVVDLSSPNLAKEMHVGHLRSTVIGDCVARILEFAGHTVHRENHVGDWGTQFGMLVAYLRRVKPEAVADADRLVIADLEAFYIEAKALFDADEDFKKESRDTVVALQGGDPATRRIWQAFCAESLRHCHAIYDRLGVRLEDRGESFYTDLMTDVVARLESTKRERPDDAFVSVSDGALCVFLEGFKTRDGAPLPLIVRKSDGGFNYATSDLATILHRVEQLHAKRIIYVVGLAQKQHFEMVFAAARQAGWVADDVSLEHLGFGNMLSTRGTPFKTREGGTIKLKDLLGEAVESARRVITNQEADEASRHRGLSGEEVERIAETVGLAAVKYFDLSHALGSDYKFELDRMVSMEGNTAPYMLYAYARICSIARMAGVDFRSLPACTILLEHPSEILLAKRMLQFAETLEVVSRELRPNVLTDYLYDLAKAFSRFYDKKLGVRVIDAAPESVRISRLRLCDLSARTLKLGLHLLGIETVEQM